MVVGQLILSLKKFIRIHHLCAGIDSIKYKQPKHVGWCMRLGPALVCGVFRCIGASAGGGGGGGGSNRGGVVNGLLPGCLIVLCSLGTDWMMGGG